MTCLHRAFEDQVQRDPEAPALSFGETRWTYGKLGACSDTLAHRLRERGVGLEHRVGVMLERSPHMVAALLAILKVGAAYLPLDPSFPSERLRFMVRDGLSDGMKGARGLVLVDASRRDRLDRDFPDLSRDVELLSVESSKPAQGNTDSPRPEIPPDALAYVLYTSGSTGRPKGVQISHRAAVSFLDAIGSRIPVSARDVLLAVTTLSFDISVLEIFLPLSVGAHVVLADAETARDGLRLRDLLESHRPTLMQATPATWALVLEAGWRGPHPRRVLSGGEALSEKLASRLIETGAEVWNLYGPTEATVWATAGRVSTPVEGLPTLGRPLSNTGLHLLDAQGEPVSGPVPGEVYLSGAGLSRGYLHRPGLTAERFLPDPLRGAGGRLYRVGDLAQYREDGDLEFLGRVDHQIKLRGYRVEPGEIEAVLERHPSVRESVVVAWDDAQDVRFLAAYLSCNESPMPTPASLRDFAAQALPTYMVPSRFVILDRLPRSPNGKIARADLPSPEDLLPDRSTDTTQPRSDTERFLAEIWTEVLDIEDISIHDDFFALGGHSLAALHVMTQVRNRFGLNLHLGTLLRAPTIADLAALLDTGGGRGAMTLVRLDRSDCEGRPFFCVHGAGGFVFRLIELAQTLPAERPFFGIQGWTDLTKERFSHRVEELAKNYVAEVRSVQPKGPYLLGGYSMGALIALEMTSQLESVGQMVSLLSILDTSATEFSKSLDADTLLYEAALARELGISVTDEQIRALEPAERLPFVVESGLETDVLPNGFRIEDALQYLRRFQATFQAYAAYEPRRCEAPIGLFLSEELTSRDEFAEDPTLGWDALSRQGVTVHSLPGNHITMLRSPHVGLLAERLAHSLANAGTPILQTS